MFTRTHTVSLTVCILFLIFTSIVTTTIYTMKKKSDGDMRILEETRHLEKEYVKLENPYTELLNTTK